MAHYRIAQQAEADLDNLWFEIAQDHPVNADRFLDRLYETFVTLSHAPYIGPARPYLAPDLRMFPVGNHLIFYRPVEDGIEVVRVLHGRRRITRRLF